MYKNKDKDENMLRLNNESTLVRFFGMRACGFTLAEVLITLGVIGIVAAMTLPALINDLNEKHYRIMWRKIYSDLSNATLLIQEKEPFTLNESEQQLAEKYGRYLQKAKICETKKAIQQSCWPSDKKIYGLDKRLYSSDIGNIGGGSTCMQISNSAVVCFDSIIVLVDVNGSKLPNTIGKDIFAALVDRNKYVLNPAKGRTLGWGASDNILVKTTSGDGTCQTADFGWGCSAEYLLSDK